MRKFYALLPLLLAALLTATSAQAQTTTGRAYVGYAQYNEDIWEYDGLSLDRNARVGCAILLTKDVLAPYIGGTITGMRVGWDTSSETGTYEGFVRETFNGEDLTTGKATVKYDYQSSAPGWNNLTLTKYEIPEGTEQLVVGFTTNLKKDVCAIPTLYPHNTPNSCYLWVEGDNDAEGNPQWVDMSDRGILPILLIIQDSKGTFNFLPALTMKHHNGITTTDAPLSCLVRMQNRGSQTIRNFEITSRQGDKVQSQTVNLSKAIAAGTTSSTFSMPLYAFESGDVELSFTKVNGKELETPIALTDNVIAVPKEVSQAYTLRPLVEYYESENSYAAPRYWDEYVAPVFEGRRDEFVLISQHLDDQFMTGDDDATTLVLRLCDNDSSRVSLPSMSVNRAEHVENILYQQGAAWDPTFSVLLEPFATPFFDATLLHPTFMSLAAEGKRTEDGKISVSVTGDWGLAGVENGRVLPEGEEPRLTVYLMERSVTSDSQLFWTDDEKEAHRGEYTHDNLIREILTAPEGDPFVRGENYTLSTASGEATPYATFSFSFETETFDDWNTDNLYLVAFAHRDGALGGHYMHVFNATEGDITLADGIGHIETSPAEAKKAGKVYDLQGRRITGRLQRGIYVTDGKTIIR